MTPLGSSAIAAIISGLSRADEHWHKRAYARLDTLTKPVGSLGRLEGLAAQVIAIRRDDLVLPIRKAAYVFAADHGVTAAGVSAYPSAVTRQMVLNFLRGGAAVSVLARLNDVVLHIVDVGVDADFECVEGLLHHKVCRGTRNMLKEAAMEDEQLAQALRVGARLADEAASAGNTFIAVGEMGIGNTTSASAITCALTGALPVDATGRGTGLDRDAHRRKIETVAAIVKLHFSGPMGRYPVEVLRCAGGLEIAAMVGMVLAASRNRLVIVLDGFISAAAAAIAVHIEPIVRDYLIAGHRSEEPGHKILLDHLRLDPVLTLDMRLGEGSGAVLALPVLEAAIALYSQMATFADAGVSEALS